MSSRLIWLLDECLPDPNLVSRRKRAARAAAKRIPIAGTAVALAPLVQAASVLTTTSITTLEAWKVFVKNIAHSYTGINPDTGELDGTVLMRSYAPIVAYIIARRFAVKHISRALRPLGVKF